MVAQRDEVVLTTCPRDCYYACGIAVVKRYGAIKHVRGDPRHPVRGKLCRKCSIAYNRAFLDAEARLTCPRALCDPVAVMYLGRIVESGTTVQVIGNPKHPYTQSLLSVVPTSFPRKDLKRTILEGELPDASNVPSGCRFHPRCPKVFDRCPEDGPRELLDVSGDSGHGAACWLLDRGASGGGVQSE